MKFLSFSNDKKRILRLILGLVKCLLFSHDVRIQHINAKPDGYNDLFGRCARCQTTFTATIKRGESLSAKWERCV